MANSGRGEMGRGAREEGKTEHEDRAPYRQAYWYTELPTTQLCRLPVSKIAIFEKYITILRQRN